MTTVGPPIGLVTSIRPSTAWTRSVRPESPLERASVRTAAPPLSVVPDRDAKPSAALGARDRRFLRMSVLRDVGEQLGDAEVSDRLDRLRWAIGDRDGELGRHGASGRQRRQRTFEADVERRWMDTPARSRSSTMASLAPRCASSSSWRTGANSEVAGRPRGVPWPRRAASRARPAAPGFRRGGRVRCGEERCRRVNRACPRCLRGCACGPRRHRGRGASG